LQATDPNSAGNAQRLPFDIPRTIGSNVADGKQYDKYPGWGLIGRPLQASTVG
jgi:hypothetical protein